MNKSSVCIVTTAYPRWDGDFSGPMVKNLTRVLNLLGYTTKIVTQIYPNAKPYEIVDQSEVFRFRYTFLKTLKGSIGTSSGVIDDLRKSWKALLALPFFIMSFVFKILIVTKNCNVIHVQWVPTIIVALPSKYFRKIPIIVNSRTNPDTTFWKSVYKILLKQADYVIYNSNATKAVTDKIYKHPNSVVVGSGININQFKRPVNYVSDRNKSEVIKIISIARLVQFKGIEYLISAIGKISNKIPLEVNIYGDGPLKKSIELFIARLNLNDIVKLLGDTPHNMLPSKLWDSDIFVLPSIIDDFGRTEGFGAVILEAMAARLPVIASRVGGIVDIIQEDQTGILVEPQNVNQLAESIILLSNNKNERKRIAENAFEWVNREYSDLKTADAYKKIYDYILHGKKNTSIHCLRENDL